MRGAAGQVQGRRPIVGAWERCCHRYFGFLPITDSFRQSAEQVARVERMSDAHHLEVCGDDVLVGYLLEVVHRR